MGGETKDTVVMEDSEYVKLCQTKGKAAGTLNKPEFQIPPDNSVWPGVEIT